MMKQEQYKYDMSEDETALSVFSILASLNVFECGEKDLKPKTNASAQTRGRKKR
jgi:hypothetical protein